MVNLFQSLVEQLNNFLTGDFAPSMKTLTLKVLMVLVTVSSIKDFVDVNASFLCVGEDAFRSRSHEEIFTR